MKYEIEVSILGKKEMIFRGKTDDPDVAYDIIQRIEFDINPHAKYDLQVRNIYRGGKKISLDELQVDIAKKIDKILNPTTPETD